MQLDNSNNILDLTWVKVLDFGVCIIDAGRIVQ